MTNEGDALENISLAAAMASSYARDQQGFITLVALMLESSLPNIIDVERKPVRLFSSEKKVTALKVTLGDAVFEMKEAEGRPIARKIRIVRNITLKTDELPIDRWLADLDIAIRHYARNNQNASVAITDYLRAQGLQ